MGSDEDYLTAEFELIARQEKVGEIIAEMQELLQDFNHQIPDLEFRLEVVARELMANAIKDGCQQKNDVVEIKLKGRPQKLTLTVKDPGEGFNCEITPLADIPTYAENGRGLAMVHHTADELKFNDRGNVITCCFY